MSITDIIPDIHGQAEKLRVALRNLGWHRSGTSWTHPEPDRQIVFLGDFIDRGPENSAVIRIVRQLMDAGRAQAIMGNHELNALHFHTLDPDTGLPLRSHEKRNIEQHESFLKEFPIGAPDTKAVLDWMKDLPLFIENDGFRAVHAAWIQSAIDDLRAHTPSGVLSEEQLIRAACKGDAIFDLAETLAKGPEQRLPENYFFTDENKHVRHHVRLKWWNGDAKTWREVAMSVPNLEELPDELLPLSLATNIYPLDEKPVFFGHYWMSGEPELQSSNALCLDYSAGTDGPLVTYKLPARGRLSLECVHVHTV
ncbi:Bis(5'-nucleosyl)-tetraphosphatase PrpE [asymmetrical] [Roseovarius gaetbuli]|uniref:Bis(5'-nucleosyl)-tetraphosphatase PrpE [asymmetrical] n=1 Tax=Roseovarius gaetbuli TaxID=1356575 RepID=A0A1X6ZQW9_9RHOB|nr:metallophosphoesterase [Roseovarius gaetbuli]SLN58751.1 Bis(5'-nucleosyl)-tetraphosphatase PrpE [asymmetrical] [Roseovarius gaetbuli]